MRKAVVIFAVLLVSIGIVFIACARSVPVSPPERAADSQSMEMKSSSDGQKVERMSMPAIPEPEELHLWVVYKLALATRDDKHVIYHVKNALSLSTDPQRKKTLDSLITEHMMEEHFIHTKNIVREILGEKTEPALSTFQLEARSALLLVEGKNLDMARQIAEHLQTIAIGADKEVMLKVIKAMQQGDMEDAGRSLTRLSGG